MSTEFDKNFSKWSWYILHWSQRLHWKLFWTFSVEVIRPAKITIWEHHFRNNLFLKMKLSRNAFYKSWAPRLIFSNEFFFRNIRIIFDIEKWLWKLEFCNFEGLITSTKNIQKKVSMQFLWSLEYYLHFEKLSSNSVNMVKNLLQWY